MRKTLRSRFTGALFAAGCLFSAAPHAAAPDDAHPGLALGVPALGAGRKQRAGESRTQGLSHRRSLKWM
jgi:hypothetical protein